MNKALETWREKLDDYQSEEAIAVGPDQKFQLKKLIEEAKAKIAELEATSGSQPTASPATVPADISRIIKYAPTELIGREAETQLLNDAWAKVQNHEAGRPHILTFVALGGEGKTSLVAKWVADLAHRDWPRCEAVFAWSFYSQGTREQTAVSSDLFLAEALNFFGDAAMAGSAAGAFDKGRRLAQLVGQRRALLILDGLEPLQYAPTSPTPGELKDQGVTALLTGLAANSHGLCVVTTRYALPDLRAFHGKSVWEEKLTRLATDAGVALLQSFGVRGNLRKTIPSPDGRTQWNEFEKLVEDVKGHALTLQLLGSYLRDAHAGDIRRRDLIQLEEADAEEQGGHAFRVMDAYVRSFEQEATEGTEGTEKKTKPKPSVSSVSSCSNSGQRGLALLRLLGLFDRPASADCLNALWNGEAIAGLTEPLIGLSEAQRNVSLQRLEDAKLLTVNRDAAGTLVSLDAHPLLREYFGKQLRGIGFQPVIDRANDRLEAYPTSAAWRTAHRRLYEHLCATTPDKPDATLEDLQPLYQAVAHGCQAGCYRESLMELYYQRIQRRNVYYATNVLGATGSDLSVLAGFFIKVWDQPESSLDQAGKSFLLRQTAFSLRSAGRFREAEDPAKLALTISSTENDKQGGNTIAAGIVSELALILGRIHDAVNLGNLAVRLSTHGQKYERQVASRCILATALHQAGQTDASLAIFQEAERIEANGQPDYPLLRSIQGFAYHELLLSLIEVAAWKVLLFAGIPTTSNLVILCERIMRRATMSLNFAIERRVSILSVEINRLTIARVFLYESLVQRDSSFRSEEALQVAESLSKVVDGLRQAGQQQFVLCGLLTRAWQRSLTGARTGPESAQSDLDEAWEIAARGPMPLFLADILLYRARLRIADFRLRNEKMPQAEIRNSQSEIAEARRLIEKHRYLRRLPELEDAEAALHPLTNEPTP